jgi:hypothetical protein
VKGLVVSLFLYCFSDQKEEALQGLGRSDEGVD